ncbi:LuxR family transcriptional regulator [Pseudomonas sp.]|uniref:helix-turn-helix transcriptional regulator n=1 Tax=Pseudomonas sp. TaxID=306 RepID=UPI00262F0FD4|nr:LuxR family transcriptional regulator [Pseudomonas sp.]
MGHLTRYSSHLNISEKNIIELYDYAQKSIRALGFDYFIFRMIPSPLLNRNHGTVLTNIAPHIMQPYETPSQIWDSPIIRHCLASVLPLTWSVEACPKLKVLVTGPPGNHGWSQALHDHTGVISLITVLRTHQPFTEQDLIDNGGQVMWLCSRLHACFMDKCLPTSTFKNPAPSPTAREIEVLQWHGLGKTASEIAEILSLSSRTVNFHLSSIYRKLGASNNKQALVIAAKLGLI